MRKTLALAYGIVAYLMFLGVYFYLAGFLANYGVPKSIDSGESSSPIMALAVNSLLLLLFGAQHSVMARPGFKRWWTRLVPKTIERSTYVMFSNLLLLLLFWQWRPVTTVVWSVESGAFSFLLYDLFLAGVLIVPLVTLFINHFDLFGLRQVWLNYRDRAYTRLRFVTPGPYRLVRHPLYVGWILMFWATPEMTVGHLLFAGVLTGYILIAIRFEERDLSREFGRVYAKYKAQTPMLIPRVRPPASVRSRSTGEANLSLPA